MNAIAFHILTMFISAGGPAVPQNALLNDLATKGVTMPDGQVVQLPPPVMPEGLTAAQQAEVLQQIATADKTFRGKVDRFIDRHNTPTGAPVSLKLGKIPSKQGNDLIRTVNAYFVVYGSWDVLTNKEFANGILKPNKGKNNNAGGTAVIKAGNLSAPEMAVRKLSARSTSELKEYYLYTTIKLFDEVQLSATRFGAATKTPTGVVVAAMGDPRFAKDKQFPNQWCPITKNAAGEASVGDPQAFPRADAQDRSGAGFYAKVTRLASPSDAIFVEFHSAFYEPEGWFGPGNDNRLPNELRKIIPFKAKDFRIQLTTATENAAKENATAEKKSGDDTEKK